MSRSLYALVAATGVFLAAVGAAQVSRAQQVPNVRLPQNTPPLITPNALQLENWGFELGLTGWEKTGAAFNSQPTYGDNVAAKRVVGPSSQFRMPLGGTYWSDVIFPIGHKGSRWVGTYENHPENNNYGRTQGDPPVGTLTSKAFTTDKSFISFLIGGGEDINHLSVSLYERTGPALSASTACDVFTPPRLNVSPQDLRPANTPQLQTAPQLTLPPGSAPRSPAPPPAPPAASATATVDQIQCADGIYKLVAGTPRTGLNNELLRRDWWSVAALRSKTLRIRIVDNRSANFGHINVDDFRFEAQEPTRVASPMGGSTRMVAPYTFRPAAGAQPAATGYVDWDAPVWGIADLHTHPMAHLGFGKKLLYGKPDGDMATELANCNHDHGGWGVDNTSGNYLRSIIVNMVDKSYVHRTSDTKWDHQHAGAQAAFAYWPHFSSATHQQMRWEWIKRAHEGGLRVMVALAVNNQLLADGIDGDGAYTAKTSDKVSGDEQIQATKDFVAWVKRQPGGDFLDIVTDPAQMRDTVRKGKLAVILGMEVDNIGNFNRLDVAKNPAAVVAEVRRLHAMGVRYAFPIHVSDNAFGGAAVYDGLFNLANRYAATQPLPPEIGAWAPGTAFAVEHAPDPEVTFRLTPLTETPAAVTFQFRAALTAIERLPTPFPNPCFPCPVLIDPISVAEQSARCEAFKSATGLRLNTIDPQVCGVPALEIRQMFQPKQYELMTRFFLTPDPRTDTYGRIPGGHRNAKGLTDLGQVAILEMMRLGMIIDIDHMSEKSVEGTLRLAEGIPNGGYPVVSGHTGFRAMQHNDEVNENQRSDQQLARIQKLGGMMGLGWGYSTDKHNDHIAAFNDVIARRGGRAFTTSNVDFAGAACAGSSRSFAQNYLYGIEKIGAVAIGSDINGMIAQPSPRFGPLATADGNVCRPQPGATRVAYSGVGGLTPSSALGKTWDFNAEGFVHYGMFPDFLQDLKQVGINPQDMSPLFNSAEAFASTWTKAVQRARDVR